MRAHMSALTSLVAAVSVRHEALLDAVSRSPALFKRPRTRSFDGVKVGFRKKPGKVVIADEERTVQRIRERLPTEQAELLLRVRESVVREAVSDLSAADLKRLGIAISDDTDQPVVSVARTDLDRLVDALLADGDGEALAAHQ